MTPEQIAARLSPAQKRALLWMPGEGTREFSWRGHGNGIWDIEKMRLAASNYEALHWRLTPLGQAVRAIVAQEGRDG